jgi:heme/copper-type cytochrome/quinol oxidase subunit 2
LVGARVATASIGIGRTRSSAPSRGRWPAKTPTQRAMFLNFGLLFNVVLMVGGILWCHAIFGRWQKDVAEYKAAKDPSTRQAIAILWAITAVVVLLLINFFVGILMNLGLV